MGEEAQEPAAKREGGRDHRVGAYLSGRNEEQKKTWRGGVHHHPEAVQCH